MLDEFFDSGIDLPAMLNKVPITVRGNDATIGAEMAAVADSPRASADDLVPVRDRSPLLCGDTAVCNRAHLVK